MNASLHSMRFPSGRAAAAALWLLAMASGCGPKDKGSEASAPEPRVEDMSWGSIELIVTADPAKVSLDRDILLTLRTTAPDDVDVTIPPLDDRLQGFVLSGAFDQEPFSAQGKTTRERHLRLTPVLADAYRLAPMAIHYTDRSKGPAAAGWFATRPMVFDVLPPVDGEPGKDIEPAVAPVWIHPPFTSVAAAVAWLAAGVAAAVLAWRLLRRVRKRIQLMRMSPRERSLSELSSLLAQDLIAKDRVKDFYLELTMIVRRYIERAHRIRAPEQTTEEFLQAVAGDHRFSPDVLQRLSRFLEAADLVKFAAYRPAPESVGAATETAKNYIETDHAERQAALESAAGGDS